MVVWESLYEESATNAQILASASETFLSNNTAKQQMTKFSQSFNALEISNDDNAIVVSIDLDGLSTRRRLLFAKGNFTILPEDGIFFNTIKINNTDAANNLAAGKIRLNARMLKPRGV